MGRRGREGWTSPPPTSAAPFRCYAFDRVGLTHSSCVISVQAASDISLTRTRIQSSSACDSSDKPQGQRVERTQSVHRAPSHRAVEFYRTDAS